MRAKQASSSSDTMGGPDDKEEEKASVACYCSPLWPFFTQTHETTVEEKTPDGVKVVS